MLNIIADYMMLILQSYFDAHINILYKSPSFIYKTIQPNIFEWYNFEYIAYFSMPEYNIKNYYKESILRYLADIMKLTIYKKIYDR